MKIEGWGRPEEARAEIHEGVKRYAKANREDSPSRPKRGSRKAKRSA